MPFGLRRNPVWRDSSNVKRERAVGDWYGIEGMSSDRGILLGIILNFCHFLSVLRGLTLEVDAEVVLQYLLIVGIAEHTALRLLELPLPIVEELTHRPFVHVGI